MTQEYIKWRGNSRATVTEFAEYLGISQSLLSHYMRKDGKTPNSKNLIQIAQKLGLAVYDVLSLPRPPERPASLLEIVWDQLTPEGKAKIIAIMNEDLKGEHESVIKQLESAVIARKS